MAKIISVMDFFDVGAKGIGVGGVNPFFDELTDSEIKKQIGGEILITKPDNSVAKFPVLDVNVSMALSGKKNLFLLLPKEAKTSIVLDAVISN